VTAPRIPHDWTAPLRRAGFEPTELHVHDTGAAPLEDADEAQVCPPCTGNCTQGRHCPRTAANASRWHDSATHPAEWLMLAIAAALCGGLVVMSILGSTVGASA